MEAERGIPVGTTKMLAMVETASAFFRIAEIARAHPRLVALNLGAEDFALSAGMLPEAEGLFMPKQTCVFAARAAGIMPMGFVGTVADFSDLDGFRETVRRSRRLGFVGASVIHPSQIAILNEEFRPERRRGRPRAPRRRRLRQGAGRGGRRGHRRRQDDRRAGRRARQAAAAARGRRSPLARRRSRPSPSNTIRCRHRPWERGFLRSGSVLHGLEQDRIR